MHSSPLRTALAALLVLSQLLAPLAHRPAPAVAWFDVCTGDGLRRVPAEHGPESPHHGADHCVLCRVSGGPAGLPPATLNNFPAPAARSVAARVAVLTIRAPTRFDAPARAPPTVG